MQLMKRVLVIPKNLDFVKFMVVHRHVVRIVGMCFLLRTANGLVSVAVLFMVWHVLALSGDWSV